MPYLHCHRCRRTAWVRALKEEATSCRHCGTTLSSITVNETAFLTGAVRERFIRDARRDAGRMRFVREAPRLTE